jgi:ketosteroid isomerase-like protein
MIERTVSRASTDATRSLVEQAYGAFAARDIPALLGLLDPAVEWGEADNPLIPAAGMRSGIDGVLEWLRIGQETEDIRAFEVRRILVDGDMAAAIGRTVIVARPTGRAYELDFVHLVTVADGRIVRFVEFFDTWAAAEAFRG